MFSEKIKDFQINQNISLQYLSRRKIRSMTVTVHFMLLSQDTGAVVSKKVNILEKVFGSSATPCPF